MDFLTEKELNMKEIFDKLNHVTEFCQSKDSLKSVRRQGNVVREGIGNVQDGSTVIKMGLVTWVR